MKKLIRISWAAPDAEETQWGVIWQDEASPTGDLLFSQGTSPCMHRLMGVKTPHEAIAWFAREHLSPDDIQAMRLKVSFEFLGKKEEDIRL